MIENLYKRLPPLERRPDDGSLYRMTSAQRKQANSLIRRECCNCEGGAYKISSAPGNAVLTVHKAYYDKHHLYSSAGEIIGNRANLTKWQDDFHAYMVEKYPDLERGESASKTGRKNIPTQLFKQAVSLSKQARAIEATLDGINPINAGKKKEEALTMLKKRFPQMENFSGQLKKYKATINDLLEENQKLEARARASESGKMKDRMERAKLESELQNIQRLVDRIPPDILAEVKRQKEEAGA